MWNRDEKSGEVLKIWKNEESRFIDDIDFSERECVVYGKGDKERKAYFDAKTKIHLMNYIESRTDNNSALFVSLNKPHSRLTESGVELRLREMGKKLGVEKVHPHKFI